MFKSLKSTLKSLKSKAVVSAIGIYYSSVFRRCVVFAEKLISKKENKELVNKTKELIDYLQTQTPELKRILTSLENNMKDKEKIEQAISIFISEEDAKKLLEIGEQAFKNFNKNIFLKFIETNKDDYEVFNKGIAKDVAKFTKVFNKISL